MSATRESLLRPNPLFGTAPPPGVFVPNSLPECPEKMRLINLYSGLKMDAFLSGGESPVLAKDLAWELLMDHIREHGCHKPLPED